MPALILAGADLASADWAGAARSAGSRTAARKTARQVILLRRAGHTLEPPAALLKDGIELGAAHFELAGIRVDPLHKGFVFGPIPAALERSAILSLAVELEVEGVFQLDEFGMGDGVFRKIGRDEKFFLAPFYKIRNLPYLALYDKKGNLIKLFHPEQQSSERKIAV